MKWAWDRKEWRQEWDRYLTRGQTSGPCGDLANGTGGNLESFGNEGPGETGHRWPGYKLASGCDHVGPGNYHVGGWKKFCVFCVSSFVRPGARRYLRRSRCRSCLAGWDRQKAREFAPGWKGLNFSRSFAENVAFVGGNWMLGENPNLIRNPNRISNEPVSGGPPARVHAGREKWRPKFVFDFFWLQKFCKLSSLK